MPNFTSVLMDIDPHQIFANKVNGRKKNQENQKEKSKNLNSSAKLMFQDILLRKELLKMVICTVTRQKSTSRAQLGRVSEIISSETKINGKERCQTFHRSYTLILKLFQPCLFHSPPAQDSEL